MKILPAIGRLGCSVNLGALVSRKLFDLESCNFTNIEMGQVDFSGMRIFPLGRLRVAAPLV